MNSQEFQGGSAQEREVSFDYLHEVKSFEETAGGARVSLADFTLEISWQKQGIIRLTAAADQNFDHSSTPAVVGEKRAVNVNYRQDEEGITLTGPQYQVRVMGSPLQILFYDEQEELIHADVPGGVLGKKDKKLRCRKELRPNERIYGLGEKTGYLDKRGKSYTMWNTDEARPHVPSTDPLYVSLPFFIGFKPKKTYGIYFDNSFRSHFDVGDTQAEQLIYTAEGGKLDYYFYGGPSIAEVVERHTWLTGRHPMPPLWSLGFHQSRYSYYSSEEVEEIAERMRKEDIPCDAIHLDIHYMDDFRVFTWDDRRFPKPADLAANLQEKGINLITIVDPGIKKDPEYEVYQQGIENDYFCNFLSGELYTGEVWPGDSVFPDFTEAEVREWWQELHEIYFASGIRGIWNDMNEPADFNERRTLPEEVYHKNDGDPGTHRRFHNLYALHEAKATRKAIKKYREERPFVLSRAGFAGIQRYSALWTGDNRSFWQHLEMNVPMLANMGLSGVGFCGSDVGGFSDDCRGELLTRWTQLGALMPFFRNHTCIGSRRQEPWAFGEPFTSINRQYIKFRYELLPHLYNLFYQMTQTGAPIWRPPVWHFPGDRQVHNLNDQIMIGSSLMAVPVCRPDQREKRVYLPAGGWYNFWTGEYFRGGQSWMMEAPLDTLPLFVRENSAVFLQQEPGKHVPKDGFGDLVMQVYPGRTDCKDRGELYLDDGISFKYEKGEYDLYSYELNTEDEIIEISIWPEQRGFAGAPEKIELAVSGLEQAPEKLSLNGETLTGKDFELKNGKIMLQIYLQQENFLKIDNS